MVNRKDRRHSGRKVVFSDDPDYPTKYDFYSEWDNYRDGMRYDPDETHIRPERMLGWWKATDIAARNKKLKRQLRLRQMKRFKQWIRNNSINVLLKN